MEVDQINNQADQQKPSKYVQTLWHQPWLWSLFWWLVLLLVLVTLGVLASRQAPMGIVIAGEQLSDTQRYQLYQKLAVFDKPNFYHADIDGIANTLMTLSWVDSVQVRRDWQQGVVAAVRPKVAVANFGSEHMLDVYGDVFSPADSSELNNPTLIQLYSKPTSANDAMDKVQKLNLWFAPLGIAVEDMILTPRQTWLVRFNSGLRVTVDYDQVDEKLFRLSRLLAERRLGIHLDEIAAIDLRYKNGFSLTKKLEHNQDGRI